MKFGTLEMFKNVLSKKVGFPLNKNDAYFECVPPRYTAHYVREMGQNPTFTTIQRTSLMENRAISEWIFQFDKLSRIDKLRKYLCI